MYLASLKNYDEFVSEDNDRLPIRFGRAFRFANPIRAKLNLPAAKSTNFIDLERASKMSSSTRARARRVRKVRRWFEKELRGLGLNANRAGAL